MSVGRSSEASPDGRVCATSPKHARSTKQPARRILIYSRRFCGQVPNGGVDAAARIKAPFAAPSKLREALPPLASNELFGGAPASYVLRLVYPRFRCADDAHTVAAYNEYPAVL